MHSDGDHVKKRVRTYRLIGAALFMFTAITVGVNQVHLVVPMAITVALIIAAIKGSMVASVFMHLSHEKQWIYGALLLTVLGFIILIFVPLFTVMDGIGTLSETARAAAEQAAHTAGH
jgi:caa(3)-type oxidase subunit IV